MATTTATRKRNTRRRTGPADLTPAEQEQPETDTTDPADPTPAEQEDEDDSDAPTLPGDYKALRVKKILPNPKNLRTDAQALPGIVENLQQDGISGLLAPLIVVPYGKDRYLAVDGEQRYWSAVEAKQKWVQAIIREDLAGNVDQIISMLRQVHRTDPTAHQLAQGVEQLALYGMDDDEIARRTGFGTDRVKAARAVARLDQSISSRAQQSGLDLTQQAILQKFADTPETVEALLEEAEDGPFAFARAVEVIEASRRAQASLDQRRGELAAAGTTVLTERQDYYSHPTTRRVDDLRTEDGQRVSDEDHAGCPGHAVAVFLSYHSHVPVEIAYCTDWKANGHATTSVNGTTTRSGKMTDEQKAERRTVIDNNKAMDAANTVRRKWAADLIAGSTEPKGSKRIIAEELAEPSYLLAVWVNGGRKMLDDILSPGKTRRPGTKRVPARASETRHTMIALASVIAAHESAITRSTWRNKDENAARYLKWCTLNGYEPGKVEQLVIDGAAGTVTDTTTRPALSVVTNTEPDDIDTTAELSSDEHPDPAAAESVLSDEDASVPLAA